MLLFTNLTFTFTAVDESSKIHISHTFDVIYLKKKPMFYEPNCEIREYETKYFHDEDSGKSQLHDFSIGSFLSKTPVHVSYRNFPLISKLKQKHIIACVSLYDFCSTNFCRLLKTEKKHRCDKGGHTEKKKNKYRKVWHRYCKKLTDRRENVTISCRTCSCASEI